MTNLQIIQVDAFTIIPLSGNPCAVVLGADNLTETTMQKIALEMNLSETAFVMDSNVADFRARYFTPAEEVPLAGHPTIATVHTLIKTGLIPLEKKKTISLELEAGVISVEISNEGPDRTLITMSQLRPEFLRVYDPTEVLPAFGLEVTDLLDGAPIMTVSTGTPQLMIPLKSVEVLKRVKLMIDPYVKLRANGDFFSAHLFVLEGISEKGTTFARHFGVPPDTFEDPFTGSATGGMAAYLWHHRLLETPRFIAEQGHLMGRPGEAYVELVGNHDDIKTVKVGGYAVDVMQGVFTLPDISNAC